MNQQNRSRTNRRRDASPTIAEIRAARDRAGLNQAEAARRIHSPLCAWKCWESEGEENRPMHPGLFELFLIKTGQTDVQGCGVPVPDELDHAPTASARPYGIR